MALSRATGLCRLALRTQWVCARVLSSVAAGGEAASDDVKPRRLVDLEALRRERGPRPPAEPASPRRMLSSLKPSYEQVQLNKAITRCTSVDKVLELALAQPALLNGVIVSTALSVIARLMGNREAALGLKADARFKQLMKAALVMMESGRMDAQGFSNMLYACGQLGIAPPPSWLRVYFESSALVLGEFVPQALSNTMYSCGQLGFKPPDEWLRYFWHIDASKMSMSIPQDFSNTMYACVQLGIMPAPDWLQRFWHASALKLGDFNQQNYSNVIYACGQLGIVPPVDWLQRFWHDTTLVLGEFSPQNFNLTLYSCGQLGITPPADWLQRFWHASALKLVEFIPQEFGNTIYACGQLGITPPVEWMLRYWQASAAKMGDFIPQNFSNIIISIGQLGLRPPTDWLQSFSESFERLLPAMDRQCLVNTALALATLELWELPAWPSLWEHLCRSMPQDAAGWDADARIHGRQWYQAYQAAAMERPGLLLAPDPELLSACRKCWIEGMDEKSSRLHADVSTCLTSMGITHTNERWCERAERSIDIVIEGAGAPVALEVDGPTHFLQDGRQDGRTQLRNRMLAAHGWRVVVLNHRDWDVRGADMQREDYLRNLLAQRM